MSIEPSGGSACSSARKARRGRCRRCSTDRCFRHRRRPAVRRTVIDQLGSNRRSSADNVALMVPGPHEHGVDLRGCACLPGLTTEPIVLCVRASFLDRQIIPAAADPLVRAVPDACGHDLAKSRRGRRAGGGAGRRMFRTDPSRQHRVPSPVTSPATEVAQAAARGVESAVSTIPWAQVGPGSLLATWSQVPGGPRRGTVAGTAHTRDSDHHAVPG